MKDLNPLQRIIYRYHLWFKEDREKFKEKVKNSKLYKRYEKNKAKFIITRIIILLILLSIFIALYIFNDFMRYQDSLRNLKVSNLSLGPGITYTGDINNGDLYGNGNITIDTNKYTMTINGIFIEPINRNPEDILFIEELHLGTLTQGKITIVDKSNNYSYSWDGKFENFVLKEGKITINKISSIIEYEGSFVNGNLQGIGKKTTQTDGRKIVVDGWFENGVKYSNEEEFIESLHPSTEVDENKSSGGRRDNISIGNRQEDETIDENIDNVLSSDWDSLNLEDEDIVGEENVNDIDDTSSSSSNVLDEDGENVLNESSE